MRTCHAYETGEFTAPDGGYGREWFRDLLDDLADDGLVEVAERGGEAVASLRE